MSSVSQTSYQIGVDGGGMKTECILVDARGEIVARHLAPGCNPSQAGLEKARAILTEALAALLTQSQISNAKPQITTTLLCMAGNRAFWREAADAMKDFGQITTTDDSLPVLELATGGAAGLVLHAGTGSFVAARAPDGSIHYAGGLGWKFGDPGSGSDLGRRAIGHALLELQGWAPPTALGVALKAHTGLADAAANTRFFYTAEDANARIAGFAPRVLELANDGCAPAQTAVACTVTDLVEYARLVTAKLFGSAVVPCGVSGAILNSPPAIYALKALAETHAWPVDYRFIAEPPIEGVRRLLLKG